MNEILKEYEKIKSCHLEYRKKYFEDMNINKVVFKAASSQDENNKIFSHQRRVGKKLAELGAFELVKFEDLILKASTFEDIFYFTEEVRKKIKGLGHLWSYDTALHIGFCLKKYPEKVYIQSGVKQGLKKHFPHLKYKRTIEKNNFKGLEKLECYSIENFLCTMK